MKITFVGHASILIETKGLRILSDPWWKGPCFGAQWWISPPAETDDVYATPVDYIYISHGHHDHLHTGTLRTLNKDAIVLVSSDLDLTPGIEELGFKVQEIQPDEEVELADGVKIRLTPTHGGDTLLVVDDGDEVCANLNDAVHALDAQGQDFFIAWLKKHYPHIDYAFMGYGTASHFPNCYLVPGKDDYATAAMRQGHFNQTWARLMHDLQPDIAIPFAASLCFFEEDLFAFNVPVHNADRPTLQFTLRHPDDHTRAIDATHGFVIDSKQVVTEKLHVDFDEELIRKTRAADIKRANTYGTVSDELIDELIGLIKDNIQLCQTYLEEISRDYRFVLRFRNTDKGIVIEKRGNNITLRVEQDIPSITEYDVRLTTRAQYVRMSMTSQYGHEIMFVGSGCLFDYQTRDTAFTNLHRELATMVTRHKTAPRSRFGDQSKFMYTLKTRVRKMLGKEIEDLYDLKKWLVFKD